MSDFFLERMIDGHWHWHAGFTGHRPRRPKVPKHLARARCEAHAAFDHLWKSGEMSRSAAYVWLAERMGLAAKRCHIAQFSVEQCSRVVQLCAMRDFEAL